MQTWEKIPSSWSCNFWVMIRWPHWSCHGVATDWLLCARPNRYIWQVAQNHPLTRPKSRKTYLKYLWGGISAVEHSQSAPSAIRKADGAIQECLWPCNWEVILEPSRSGAASSGSLFSVAAGLVQQQTSDHGLWEFSEKVHIFSTRIKSRWVKFTFLEISYKI